MTQHAGLGIEFSRILADQVRAAAYRMSLPDGRYAYISPGITALTGYTPEEFYARPLLIREIIGPAWRDEFEAAWSDLLKGRMPDSYTYPLVHRSGETRWMHQENALQRDAAGNPVAIEGVITDVTLLIRAEEECSRLVGKKTAELEATNRRLAEEIAGHEHAATALRDREQQLQLLIDHIPAAVSYVDAGERYRINNRAYEEWFGHSREELYGKTIREVVGDAAYAGIEDKVREALSGRAVTFESRLPYERAGTRDVRASYVPHWDEARQRVSGFYVLVSDISERKRAETLEREHLRELAHAERLSAVGEMASSIVHELSQPLMAIDNYSEACAEMLRRGRSTEAGEAAMMLHEQSSRAITIIHTLRQFARDGELESVPVDLNALVRDTLELVRHEAEMREVPIQASCAAELPLVHGVPILIEQVLLNLLRNALESTQERGTPCVPIVVTTERSAEDLVVSVRDRGCGIDPQIETELFESFVTTKRSGMGLGLAICRRIIQSHCGRMWGTNNTDGPGATFGFSIPSGVPAAIPHRST